MNNLRLIGKVMKEAFLLNFRPKTAHLILHVTNRCNMRCKHCFVPFGDVKKELTFDEIRMISKQLPDLIWLDIGGGEPLLRDDLEEIVTLFNFKELGIPTNGWETERIIDRLEKINLATSEKLIVSLSLDGMQKTHDEIRCAGSFKRTIGTFRGLKKIKGLRVKFNTVLCEKNYDDIPDLMKFVKEMGPDFHSVLMLRGSPSDPSMRLPSPEKVNAIGKHIWDIQRSYGYGRTGVLSRIQRNYQYYKQEIVCDTLKKKKQVVRCRAGRSHLVIWPDGIVSPCELLPSVGNIREKNLKGILSGPEMTRSISSIKAGGCFCTHDCNMIENILFDPKSCLKLLHIQKDAD